MLIPDDEGPIELAARALREARLEGEAIAPVRGDFEDHDLDTAYAIQLAGLDLAFLHGRRIVGRKIGLTSEAVQANLGIDTPDFGALFADMEVADGGSVDVDRLIAPRAEAELAFVIGAAIPHPDATVAEVARAVDCVLPAIEIVDSRVRDWDITAFDTIADNASSALYVLGAQPARLRDVDTRLCGMTLERGGEPVSTGAGAACLGDPILALRWLAREMARRSTPLQPGDLVLSGALGALVPVSAGEHYEARISGAGSVRVSFHSSGGTP
jgi:2-keto-4-pentenoate hydratase